MNTVAFIGLGAMGSRMARRLLQTGHRVVAWNRTRARADELGDLGASVAGTPAEAAASADVVITMLSDPAALVAVTEGPGGVASATTSGFAFLDMSTVGPEAVARLASVLPDGVGLLDAPVLGSLAEAESGTLHIFVGGKADLVQRHAPLLAALGSPVHVGPLGAGAAAKLVANATLFGVLGVLGEALALADGLGLSRTAAFDVLATTPLAAQALRRRPAIESGDYPPRYPLVLAHKDADLIQAAVQKRGIDIRVLAAARSWFADAEAAGLSDGDYSAVLAHILGSGRGPAARRVG
jgi:3-hydroxyisobutyrate dehydrogenase-like beta-hydroxyacid dehydrogenase